MNLFSFIKDKVSILDVISSYTNVKKAGVYWKGCCPFHNEKTPSFTVSPHKEIFYCFGCNFGGDAITFIAKAENTSAFEAAKYLAERYNIDIPETIQKQSKADSDRSTEEKKRYWQLCKLFARWCHDQLARSMDASKYFKDRDFDQKTLEAFCLGYFPGGSRNITRLLTFLKKENFLAQDLIDAQILIKGRSALYSPFEERLLFPITDHLGRYCGFGGRIFKAQDERPKYYNSKENNSFSKGSLLFGFDQAKKTMQEEQSAYLVEGYTDCIAMAQYGYQNCIATLGTACTVQHLKKLARHIETLYVLYDGDAAGQKAMLRLTELCWQFDLELKVISLPAGYDPASYLNNGGNLDQLTKQAKDIFLFFIDSLGSNFVQKPLAQKVKSAKKLLEIIAAIEEPFKQDILLQTAAKVFDVPYQALKEELYRSKENKKRAGQAEQELDAEKAAVVAPKQLKTITDLEKKLFSVIINNMELIQQEEVAYLLDYFSLSLQTILKKAQTISYKGASEFGELFNSLTRDEKNLISHLLIEFQEYEDTKGFEHLLKQFQKQHWKTAVNDLKLKLAKAQKEHNVEEVKKLLADFQMLKGKLVKIEGPK